MNYIVYAMVAFTALPVVFGLLLGLLRGSRRALLRLVLIMLSVIVAFALCGVVANAVMTVEVPIDGENTSLQDYIKQLITSQLPESMADFAIPLSQSLIKVIMFLLLFFVMLLLTWAIAYPLCKLFVKKGAKPRRLIGLAIGAVQGIVVALVVCIVFTGLFVQADKVTNAMVNLNDTLGEVTSSAKASEGYPVEYDDEIDYDEDEGYTNPDDNGQKGSFGELIEEVLGDYVTMLDEYVQSPICKMYSSLGAKPFEWVSSVKVDDKQVINLSSQIDVICNVLTDVGKLVKEFNGLQNFDFSALLEEGNVDDLQDLFDRIGAVMNELSSDTKAVIDDLVASLAGNIGIDLGDVKLTEIDFHQEGQIVADLYAYTQKDELTVEDADEIVEKLAESDIVLGVMKNQDIGVASKLSEEQLDAVSAKIDQMEQGDTLTPEKIDALRKIFGLNNIDSENTEAVTLTYSYAV
ncbi:MAG: CvpA family protein [Clostridiales bacterium]|nr:CvpA family protein [Clostridiales bacterium]